MKKFMVILLFFVYPFYGMKKLAEMQKGYQEQKIKEASFITDLEAELKKTDTLDPQRLNQLLFICHQLKSATNPGYCCRIHLRVMAMVPGTYPCSCCTIIKEQPQKQLMGSGKC